MHNFISINGQIQKRDHFYVPALSSAFLYGSGVFTTIAICEGRPLLWEKHWQRLSSNAGKIGLDISGYEKESVLRLLAETIKAEGIVNGRARITFTDESESSIRSTNAETKTGLSIITGGLRTIPNQFSLTVSPYLMNSTSPLAGVKSCNYLENVLAIDDAKARGFHEAIRINERGEVTSAAMANLFWLKEGKLYTPELLTGCLAGTTREFILENLECDEVTVDLNVLKSSDQIFLTSAGIGVVQVAEFGGRQLERNHHPILDLLPTV